MEAAEDQVMTQEQIKYRRRKEKHLCVGCGRQDNYTLNGRSYCRECAEIKMMRQRQIRKRDPEKTKNITRKGIAKLRNQRMAAGMCAACGKAPPVEGKTMCEMCLQKMRDYDKKHYREKQTGRVESCVYQGSGGELACLKCAQKVCILDKEES